MATLQGAGGLGADRLYDFAWTPFAASADVGTVTSIPAHVQELTIQAVGTFTGSLAIQLQGSNDGTNFSQMKDKANTAISLTDASIIKIDNPPKFIKPVATAGTGGAAASVLIHGSITG